MEEKIFTDEQLSAIETRDKTLLVSAAAGSGKTATLTERIIRSLTDTENPEDIGSMLIVTFTNAAVKELRERITAAIKKKIKENPENARLEAQLYALPSAKICTIDSFCNDILKNNTERFGISPRYRIADPIEAKILSRSVLSGLIDAVYNGELSDVASPEDFERLASCLTGVKTDSELEDVFELLYSKSKSSDEGVGVFRKFRDRIFAYADMKTEDNPYAAYAIKSLKQAAMHYKGVLAKIGADLAGENAGFDEYTSNLKRANEEISNIKKLYTGAKQKAMLSSYKPMTADDKYLLVLSSDIALLDAIIGAVSYKDIAEAIKSPLSSLPAIKGDKSEEQLRFISARDGMKKTLSKFTERYFAFSEEEWEMHVKELGSLLSVLTAFLEKFDALYFEEKKSRSMLEYSDIEMLTYRSLYNPDGSLTELALSQKEEYSSVYIDEYQDVNYIQNKIFLAVSRDNNRFTVGDIKQSIYGFRSARPDIFADMKKAYPPLEEAEESPAASIFMSKNFRCDEPIIDFVNAIFDTMFDLTRESIGYVTADRLSFAKKHGKEDLPNGENPEIHIFATEKTSSYTEEDEEEDDEPKNAREADWIADKIIELTEYGRLNNKNPVRLSDIAIILRSGAGRIEVFTEALAKRGVKARAADDRDFFLNPDVLLVLCLLNAINNPMKDIYLAGLMLSPIFKFTPDELYFARRSVKGGSLWEAVLAYAAANPESTKFTSFVNTLRHYRVIAEGIRADELLLRLYNECGLLALASKDGSRENLMLLYNYARKFEASSFEGLYNFISYVNTVIESGAEFNAGKENKDEDAVTIITVHKSKGLEFPIVFLADASTPLIAPMEKKGRVAYSDEHGIAIRPRVQDGLALLSSPIYNAIIDMNCDGSLEEELRVYYVALTRARERLFITASPKISSKDEYLLASEVKKIAKSPYSLKEMKTFVDILHFVDSKASFFWNEEKSYTDTDIGEENEENQAEEPPEISEETEEYDEALYDALCERFSYKYPSPHLTTLPEKMSVSSLHPTVLDGMDEEVRLSVDAPLKKAYAKGKRPEFISHSKEGESAKCGIATHNFLQFFDITKLDENGPSAELSRLVDEKFISNENMKRVRLDEIELFFNSNLYKEMKKAKSLYREFRFSVMLPASLFTADEEKRAAYGEEKILLQGVIDCIVEDVDGNLHLIDYKTDRLTKEELADRDLAKKTLTEKHFLQLSYYKMAIERIFGKSPTTVRVYSLPLGDTVDVL